MASKDRISGDWSTSATRQFLILQMLEKGQKRRHLRLPGAGEILLLLAAGGAVLGGLTLMLSIVL